jgi:hypothetical protein
MQELKKRWQKSKTSKSTVKVPACFFALIVLALPLLFFLSSCSNEEAAIAGMGSFFTGIMGLYICLIAVAWLAGIFSFVIWVVALVDCARRKNEDFPNPGENTKLIWILIIVFAGGIGAIIYFFMVMKSNDTRKPKLQDDQPKQTE